MTMGTFANHATIVEKEFILGLPTAGPILKLIYDYLDDHDLPEAVMCFDMGSEYLEMENREDSEEIEDWLSGQLVSLSETFKEDTGLVLHPWYHDNNDCGEPYDDIDTGLHYSVGNVYVMTPEAKRFEDHIKTVNYTMWG
jgi:hypothetical protein